MDSAVSPGAIEQGVEKQALLAAIIDSSDDAIISKTLEGIITSWNQGAERIFGYKEAEVLGKHISLLIPKNRLSEEDMIISQIRSGQRIHHFQTLRVTKDGREVPISLTISPIKDNNGRVIGASKIARDITDQLQSQEALHNYAQRLELLLSVAKTISEKMDIQVILQKLTDITTKLTGAEYGAFFYNVTNSKGESYLLYTLSGAPREAFEKFGMPRNTAVFQKTFSGEGILRSDDITKDPRYGKNAPHQGMPKGHLPVVSYLAVPVISPSGVPVGGLFFGHSQPAMFKAEHEDLVASIASQTSIAIENAQLYEEIKTLNSRKDEFIGVAGHELRTPITTIKGYLQLIQGQIEDTLSKDFVDKALRQVSKLNGLIGDLLDVSKIQSGKLEYRMTSCRLLPLIRESTEMVRHIHTSHTIRMELPSEDIVITADGAKIEQVLINFLNNAVKYSPEADTIILTVQKENNRVVVSVRDFGIGIPKAHHEKVFQRYYRISHSKYVIGGLGMGLFIAKEIIERHKGAIWVESEEGKGSTFYFSLPLP